MAGGLRRQHGHASEAEMLVEALTNANLPKLLADDAALFNTLLADLFPQTTRASRVGLTALLVTSPHDDNFPCCYIQSPFTALPHAYQLQPLLSIAPWQVPEAVLLAGKQRP